jgi:hypothetical protein
LDAIDSDIIYVATNQTLHKSTDRGVSFVSLGNFPNNITSIEVHNNDNNILYVTTRGGNGKVYKSSDQGASFEDITGSLPSVVKNIIKHQMDTPSNVMYLGTSLGVYRRDDNSNEWLPFEVNLPNTSVTDLSINIPDNQIVASTYGRGIWRSTMPSALLAADDVKLVSIENPDESSVFCGEITPQLRVKNNGQNTITQIEISYSINSGTSNTEIWNGSIESLEEVLIDLPNLDVNFGTSTIDASVDITNDYYNSNNSASISFSVNKTAMTQVVNTFETLADDLLVVAESGSLTWERGIPFGTQLNTTSSGERAYATNLGGNYPDNTRSFLYTPCYDLTTLGDPILKFDMAFDIEFDWDLLYMQYSTDSGQNWILLGSESDPNWYNSSRISGDGIASNCYNCVGGQWTGTNTTMQEYSYNLAALSNQSNIMFRFVLHTDEYVNEEGAVIDNLVVEGTTLNTTEYELEQIAVFPNPSNDIFNIRVQNLPNYELIVRDVTGKLLLEVSNTTGASNYKLDLSEFASGMYLLDIESNNKRITKKLLKN